MPQANQPRYGSSKVNDASLIYYIKTEILTIKHDNVNVIENFNAMKIYYLELD